MRVMKFGGTSVGDPSRIRNVGDIVKAALARRPVVVVSAASKVTDMLLTAARNAQNGDVDLDPIVKRTSSLLSAFALQPSLIAHEIEMLRDALGAIARAGNASNERLDLVASFGERMSVRTISAALVSMGVQARPFDAWDVGMITDDTFGGAEPLPSSEATLHATLRRLAMECVPVVTGFIGKTADGRVTTLGRGGSDYSAAVFGAAIGADEIEIWTDVDGVMSSDPRVVPSARTIPCLSFSEAAELAYFGAKVLHPKTILPAVQRAIPVRVLNTFKPTAPGTVITSGGAGIDSVTPVRAIASKSGITVVQMVSSRMLLAHGFLARIFDAFARHKVVVDLVTTSEVSVSATVDREDRLADAIHELRGFAEVSVVRERALVAVVGLGVGETVGVAGHVFAALGEAGIAVDMISQGASRVNLSMVVAAESCDRAVRTLHDRLFGPSPSGAAVSSST